MKLTKKHLKKIIREEIVHLTEEEVSPMQRFAHKAQKFVSDVTSANKPKPGDRLGTGKARPLAPINPPWHGKEPAIKYMERVIEVAQAHVPKYKNYNGPEVQYELFIAPDVGPSQLVKWFGERGAHDIEKLRQNYVADYEWGCGA